MCEVFTVKRNFISFDLLYIIVSLGLVKSIFIAENLLQQELFNLCLQVPFLNKKKWEAVISVTLQKFLLQELPT